MLNILNKQWTTDEEINQLQNINLTQEFMEHFKELKDITTNNIWN